VLDWQTVRVPTGQPVMLAGGITADNVGVAIAAVRPFAVDVSSGVELAPGKKDARLLQRLFAAVHAADDAGKRQRDQR
jgi:phosphoribosylanthranilate isomerase